MNVKRLCSTIAVVTVLAAFGSMSIAQSPAGQGPSTQPATSNKTVTTSGLTIIETGSDSAVAASGDKVWVSYVGKLENGTKFDASADHADSGPFVFTLGVGQVIKGWDEGIAGMKVGQKRQLIIPASLAYGDKAVGSIPAGSTLVFDVQLLGVQKS